MHDPTKTIVLATRNQGKIRELRQLLADFDIEVLDVSAFPQIGEIEETGSTFAENALIKAAAVSKATGLAAVADDSGLEVDALGGAPGVRSARFSGENATDEGNNALLLERMACVVEEKRACRFVSAVAAVSPAGRVIAARGAWEGRVLFAPRGTGGFGYDPLFFDPQAGLTAAEMPAEEKNARSHRGKALRALLEKWGPFWAEVLAQAGKP